MWLACKRRILTKDVLQTKGWQGSPVCMFCHQLESVDHLFLTCTVAKQVWFWMGKSQFFFFTQWNTMEDIIEFSFTLSKSEQQAFLMVFSAICWTIWKHRNELCFQNAQPKSGRNIIFLTISLLHYWLGNKKTKEKTKEEVHKWMPDEETLETIPLRVWLPGDDQLIVYQSTDQSEESSAT